MKFLGNPSSGSQAGTTYSHNSAGQYTRSRRTPVNTVGTGRRAIVRANFSSASKAWSGLTGSQQAAWAAYAAGHPYVDSLGQSIVLTGHAIFVAIGSNLQNVGSVIANFILLAFSAPQSSGVSFCKTFWQETHIAGNSIGAATYGTAYVTQFGLPPLGSRVFYKLTPVNQYGVSGVPLIGYITVT